MSETNSDWSSESEEEIIPIDQTLSVGVYYMKRPLDEARTKFYLCVKLIAENDLYTITIYSSNTFNRFKSTFTPANHISCSSFDITKNTHCFRTLAEDLLCLCRGLKETNSYEELRYGCRRKIDDCVDLFRSSIKSSMENAVTEPENLTFRLCRQ